MGAVPKSGRVAITGVVVAVLAIATGSVATAAPAPTTTGGMTVRVVPGETLSAIAARFHTTVAQLAAANRIRDPNLVVAGRALRLPGTGPAGTASSPRSVTVRIAPGETLSAIAARFHTTVAQLAAANAMTNPNMVIAGQSLHITGAGVIRPASPTSSATVTVAPGESLGAIAARAHMGVAQLAAANGLRNPNVIYAGQVLRLSAAGWSAAVGSLPAAVLAHPGRLVLRYRFLHAARSFGVAPRLLEALCWWESGWQQSAVSSTGAIGVCQMEPQTAAYVNSSLVPGGALNVHSAGDNITMAAALLGHLLFAANGNANLAIGGYYQGLPSVMRKGMLPETRDYVRGVQASAAIFPPGG